MKNGSQLLISMDGLSLEDFQSLLSRFPKTAAQVKEGSTATLDAGLLTTPGAIWGEILTGEPFYKNGCAGYSSPAKSLNSTKIASEKDLKVPLNLLSRTGSQVVVNVPLLMPKAPHRTWLSDGSLPMPISLSPSSLASIEPFTQYRPRRFSSLSQMYQVTTIALEEIFAEERNRLECARALMKERDWEMGIFRLSVFDRLAHLIGIDYLTDFELGYTSVINEFLTVLDDWLEAILEATGQVSILSAFSHRRCRALFNLNKLLSDGMFLEFENSDLHSSHRVLAFAGMDGADAASDSRPTEQMHHFHVKTRNCHQSRFDPAKTIAASPAQSCIWINWKERFTDGIVEASEGTLIRQQLADFLEKELSSRFEGFRIWSKDDLSSGGSLTDSSSPDFLIFLPETEVHNSLDSSFSRYDLPRCTHHPEGFLWSRSIPLPARVSSTEVINYK